MDSTSTRRRKRACLNSSYHIHTPSSPYILRIYTHFSISRLHLGPNRFLPVFWSPLNRQYVLSTSADGNLIPGKRGGICGTLWVVEWTPSTTYSHSLNLDSRKISLQSKKASKRYYNIYSFLHILWSYYYCFIPLHDTKEKISMSFSSSSSVAFSVGCFVCLFV